MDQRILSVIGLLAIVPAATPACAQYLYYPTPLAVPVVAVPAPMIITAPLIMPPPLPACCRVQPREGAHPSPHKGHAHPPKTPAQGQAPKETPVKRLQSALSQLGFYQGAITAQRDQTTDLALANFLKAVPLKTKKRYGNQVAAMAEAAVRHEFSLLAH